MTALETVAKKLLVGLTEARCFDADGRICNQEALHRTLDVPYLHVFVTDLDTTTNCYSNTNVANLAGITPGWLTHEEIFAIGLVLDPMSFQRMVSEIDRFSQGAIHPQNGVLTILSQDDPDEQTFCTDLAALVARSEDGRNTYYAHFFCPMDDMALLNAHANYQLEDLTARQLETLDLLLKGKSYQEIADGMKISYKTVEKHVSAVYNTTGCQNQAALIAACNTL